MCARKGGEGVRKWRQAVKLPSQLAQITLCLVLLEQLPYINLFYIIIYDFRLGECGRLCVQCKHEEVIHNILLCYISSFIAFIPTLV